MNMCKIKNKMKQILSVQVEVFFIEYRFNKALLEDD